MRKLNQNRPVQASISSLTKTSSFWNLVRESLHGVWVLLSNSSKMRSIFSKSMARFLVKLSWIILSLLMTESMRKHQRIEPVVWKPLSIRIILSNPQKWPIFLELHMLGHKEDQVSSYSCLYKKIRTHRHTSTWQHLSCPTTSSPNRQLSTTWPH